MQLGELPAALGEVRELTARYLSGTPDGFEAARTLLNRLLTITVMDDRDHIRYLSVPGQRANRRTLGTPSRPLRLNNGHFLRVVVGMSLDEIDRAPSKLRVYTANFQYQLDEGGDLWVFRYDYVRTPPDPHPASHLQIRASLSSPQCLPDGTPFERIHLPTGRITLEAVIRLLAEQFRVACNEGAEIWRPILAESEREFERIAHRPLSGPAA